MTLQDIMMGIDPQFLSELWGRQNGGINLLPGSHRRKDGSTFPVEINTGEVIYEGRKLRLAVFRDVTERHQAEESHKESEKKLRFLTRNC